MSEQTNSHARPPQQQQQQQQQSTSYPSPHSYPSPSMNPSYTYPPPQGSSGSEPYRASPTQSNSQMGQINLPPIRAIDGQSQPPAQPQAGPPAMSSHLPPPHGASMNAYYAPPNPPMPAGQMPLTSPHQGNVPIVGVRYPLPPQQDQRAGMMSGGRHKKEIKRRTKTGCLTCRKRRIKCDEAHPVCRNCQKSKRECAGYDPIFKQQPGPAQIQPAPTPTASAASHPPPPPPLQSAASQPPYANVPQGYAPASASYPPPSTSSTAPPSTEQQLYDLNSSIDPALAGSDQAMPYRQDVKGPFSNNGTYPGADRGFQVKKCRIEDLFQIANIPVPPVPASHIPPSDLSEVKECFAKDYAPGLDRLLDTTWYTTHGIEYLLSDREVLTAFSYLLQTFKTQAVQPEDYHFLRSIPSLEAKVSWQLLCLCRKASPPPALSNGANGSVSAEELLLAETHARLLIMEHLITGHTATINPALALSYPEADIAPESAKGYEVEFWKHLGTFVTLHDDKSSSSKEIEAALGTMRGILLQLENRDVIYSIAIIRHVGTRMGAEVPNNGKMGYMGNQDEDSSKVFIAKKFLEDEAANGMTQVISRVAGMVVRSWTMPASATAVPVAPAPR